MRHRTIGLIGGTTPESTVGYYRYLVREYTRRYGDYGFPEILIHSVNFQEHRDRSARGEWERNAEVMARIFEGLRGAGADFGLMTANTCHLVFDQVAARTSLPLLSIVKVTVDAVTDAGIRKVALLATLDTMNAPMYPDALQRRGIETLLPATDLRRELSRIIYEELARGEVKPGSKRNYLRVVEELRERGAEGLILGCTEIPLVVGPGDTDLPIFDTLEIHADAALRYAVRETDLVF
jgi:aspartate racemase